LTANPLAFRRLAKDRDWSNIANNRLYLQKYLAKMSIFAVW
jgi:hypothetical protein